MKNKNKSLMKSQQVKRSFTSWGLIFVHTRNSSRMKYLALVTRGSSPGSGIAVEHKQKNELSVTKSQDTPDVFYLVIKKNISLLKKNTN